MAQGRGTRGYGTIQEGTGKDVRCWVGREEGRQTHLDITCSPVQVQMQVFDLPVVCELLVNILFRRLLMHIRHEDYPPLYR